MCYPCPGSQVLPMSWPRAMREDVKYLRVRFKFGQTFYDGNAGRRAKARRARLNHRQGGLRVADAAGGLDAELWTNGFAHQLDIIHRRAAGAEAGGGFDKLRPAFHHLSLI